MCTTVIAFLPARNIPQGLIVTQKGNLCPCWNQLNHVLWAFGNTQTTPVALLMVYNGYFFILLYEYCLLRAYLYAVSKTKTGVWALLIGYVFLWVSWLSSR